MYHMGIKSIPHIYVQPIAHVYHVYVQPHYLFEKIALAFQTPL